MSRHWHRVPQTIQKLAANMYPIMSEGMSPYEMMKKFSVSTN
jgi:hypothetical protein